MEDWAYFERIYGSPIGMGAQCNVYKKGTHALKVCKSHVKLSRVLSEALNLTLITESGIPTTRVYGVGMEEGLIVMEMDFVNGHELSDDLLEAALKNDRARVGDCLDKMVELQAEMHKTTISGLQEFHQILKGAFKASVSLGDKREARLAALLDSLPVGDRLCHNDYHAKNILVDGDNYTIIDWDSASIGDPLGDAAHTYIITCMMSKELADEYLDRYVRATGADPEKIRAWLPIHAALLYKYAGCRDESLMPTLNPFLAMLD